MQAGVWCDQGLAAEELELELELCLWWRAAAA